MNPNPAQSLDTTTIRCPHCKKAIKLTEALAAPLLEAQRAQIETEIRGQANQQATESANATAALQIKQANDSAALARRELDKINREKAELDSKLADAQRTQAEFLRKERELADRTRELELTIERRLTSELAVIRTKATQEATDAARLEIVAKDEQMASLQRTIEELKQKASQGSQQLQGEAQEIELESLLAISFPSDRIEAVAKGVFGGDIVQTVIGPSGQVCGTILWESKRTRNWSGSWLPKLRDDQRAAKADVAILVTQIFPKEYAESQLFDLIDGVWVVLWKAGAPLATVIRMGMIEVARARQSQEGIETKAKTVYRYLIGATFRQHVQAVMEKAGKLQDGLEKERRAMTAIWAGREKDIASVIEHMAGMYGELSAMAGSKLAEIEGLKLEA